MQCTGCFPPWKVNIHSTALTQICRVGSVFVFRDTTCCEASYLFTTDGCKIFNVRKRVSRTRRGSRDKQVCARVDSEGGMEENCFSPCSARGPIPGSEDLNSDSLTTELRPPSPVSYLTLYAHVWRASTISVPKSV